jgi:hypothetical protein
MKAINRTIGDIFKRIHSPNNLNEYQNWHGACHHFSKLVAEEQPPAKRGSWPVLEVYTWFFTAAKRSFQTSRKFSLVLDANFIGLNLSGQRDNVVDTNVQE